MSTPQTISVDFNGNGTASVISEVPVIIGTAGYTLTSSVAAQIKAAVLAEREACAKVAEQRWREWGNLAPHSAVECDVTACEDIAAAILARNEIPD